MVFRQEPGLPVLEAELTVLVLGELPLGHVGGPGHVLVNVRRQAKLRVHHFSPKVCRSEGHGVPEARYGIPVDGRR